MLFNSYIFVFLFLPLCLILYFGCNRYKKYELGKIFLTGMSLWFYAYFNWSYLPIIVVVPAVASVIIFSGLFWVFADYIGNQVVRIIVKVVIVAIFGFMELAIFANATVPWLEGREANKPRIRVEK